VYRLCTHLLSEKYALFDITESRLFKAQNAPTSVVAGPDPLGSLQRYPDPLAAFDGPTSKRGEGRKGEGRCYAPPMENS